MLHTPFLKRLLCATVMISSLHAFKFQWGGAARLDTGFDTRRNVGTDDGATILFPYPPEYDSNGCDLNNRSAFGMTPAVSNLFFRTYDYQINNGELRSYIEADFTGNSVTTIGLLKIRHAFLKVFWPHTTLLVGQYYHPTAIEECAPNNVNFNGGLPIASYARWPQIRLEHQWHEMTFGFTLYSQFLFGSPGPDWYSSKYMRDSLTPGLCLTAEWQHNNLVAGILFNFKRLKPSNYTTPPTDLTKRYVTDVITNSVMGSAWLGFNLGDVRWNNQLSVGQNGPDFGTLGGYAVSCFDEKTGHCTYTNIGFAGIWTDLQYTKYKTLSPGLFAGIVTSLGARQCVYLTPTTHEPIFYGYFDQLSKVLRIAPRITTTFNKVFIGFEVDYCKAWFGPMNNRGKHPYTCPVDSTRFLLEAHYNF